MSTEFSKEEALRELANTKSAGNPVRLPTAPELIRMMDTTVGMVVQSRYEWATLDGEMVRVDMKKKKVLLNPGKGALAGMRYVWDDKSVM